MVKPAKFYYTFKYVEEPLDSGVPMRFECHKWEREGEHVCVYKVRPNTTWQACTCDAWRECKHMKCVAYILEHDMIHELHKWKWDEKEGWQQVNDIPSVEDLSGN